MEIIRQPFRALPALLVSEPMQNWQETCHSRTVPWALRLKQRPNEILRTVIITVASVMFLGSAAHSETIRGIASVIDGDTIEVHGERIRLDGIDAPESGQFCLDANGKQWRCGQNAAWALDAVVNREFVICRIESKDRYGRHIGTCFHHQQNLNEMMVLLGLAVAYRRYSTQYVEAEQTAMKYDLGIWKGQFIAPWDWRKGVRFDD